MAGLVVVRLSRCLDARPDMALIFGIDEEWRQALKILGVRGGEVSLVFGEKLVEAREIDCHVLSAPQG